MIKEMSLLRNYLQEIPPWLLAFMVLRKGAADHMFSTWQQSAGGGWRRCDDSATNVLKTAFSILAKLFTWLDNNFVTFIDQKVLRQ